MVVDPMEPSEEACLTLLSSGHVTGELVVVWAPRADVVKAFNSSRGEAWPIRFMMVSS
jgi:predicted dinucleotide-binding enzyme